MKHCIYSVFVIIALTSCIKDNSSYGLREKEAITVTGVEKSYSGLLHGKNIVIDPIVQASDAQADLEYLWVMLPNDTLTRTRILDLKLNKEPGLYRIRLQVRNKRTDYSHYETAELKIGTAYTRGWYVAKSTQSKTDIDLFVPGNTSQEYQYMDNVFSLNNNRKLEGDPLLMSFYGRYFAWDGKEYVPTRTLFVVSERDGSSIGINSFKEFRSFETLFLMTPPVRKPTFIISAAIAQYAANDGQLYGYSVASRSTGQFGAPNRIDDRNTPYHLSKYFIGTVLGSGAYFFDELSSSFVLGVSAGGMLAPVRDSSKTDIPANKSAKNMLYMGLKTETPTTGYAIFQDKSNPLIKTVAEVIPSATHFMMKGYPIRPTEKLYNASRYMLLEGEENLLFFVVGNEIWSRNLSNHTEQLQYVVPQGEKITLLRHRKYTLEPAYAHSYVAVGTVTGGRYKVRMFTKNTGRLNPEPAFILEGNGDYVGDLLYVGDGLKDFFTHNTSY
ncbi:PKD-like family lipoprotein [Sphingobacterium tabacisoli]|uniref:PKD-like family lipoprotein n=2 Tax=Sphingobacterium tabacisoli TaxID=2044855 RepID=A0ABW5L2Z7_9SPHI